MSHLIAVEATSGLKTEIWVTFLNDFTGQTDGGECVLAQN